jgi:hypothetical protein
MEVGKAGKRSRFLGKRNVKNGEAVRDPEWERKSKDFADNN